MAYSLSYFEEAKLDISEAKNWYKEQKSGLEKLFAQAIKEEIFNVKKNPLTYAIRHKNIRIAHPKIFPFGIHFYVDDKNNQIIIVAILHSKRNPETPSKRV